ncbi:hypothetical protein TREMEDRAFT_67751 [Tremella mesenterica DSM 1558]|uniref:uncharacterized protein n=1 Tax=Tremella mesenterica (strain ATCC 24925 / CBS 8224 / DSM 1558 / NBRC 9311 / NRRL Y-6157 / RJB 2259-6 / UBC 559-6) TaxID=578456 RepID=UPI0003F49A1F|nr:uncharacterized protein TREMEDRAFT_67751 [Tremella mesenterica DSM 1558]EIW71409.1 hypothetical protein TREMEDRAFT_67751 [Tremella mesenterica DSM 1558]
MPAKRGDSAPGPSSQPKRARFASPSPGASSLSPDDDEKERKRGPQHIGNSGYDSDSSADDEGVVPSRRPKPKDDDDMDMFADEPASDAEDNKPKAKEFMELGDVEGQEFDDENEDEEEKRAAKRKEGLDGDMGFTITPFNMKQEMQEGKFTADGDEYVENDQDKGEKHDIWLADVAEEDIEKVRKAHEEREKWEREKEAKEAGIGEDPNERRKKEEGLLKDAVGLMERGETVLEALQRLGKEVQKEEQRQAKKKSWTERQKERKAMMAKDEEENDPTHTSNPFTNLSNVISGLTALGQLDVYSLSKESIQRMLPSSSTNGSSNPPRVAPPQDDRQFQYRFSLAYMRNLPEAQRPVERELFGPFAIQQLRQWRGTGFFGGPECENVELRQMGTEKWGTWSEIVQI